MSGWVGTVFLFPLTFFSLVFGGFVMMNAVGEERFQAFFFFLIFFFFVFQSSDVLWSEYEKRMKRNRKGKITTEIDTPTFLDQRAEERQTICFFSFDFRALAESFTM